MACMFKWQANLVSFGTCHHGSHWEAVAAYIPERADIVVDGHAVDDT